MTSTSVAALVAAFVLVPWNAQDITAPPAGHNSVGWSVSLTERCALLTAAEVAEALGEHDGGKTGFEGEWGLKGCRWTSNTVQNIPDFPGWRDAIEIAVFDEPLLIQWARSEMRGDPISGVIDGAVYDATWGRLWFPCANGQICVVRVGTADGEGREEHAVRFARLMYGRVGE